MAELYGWFQENILPVLIEVGGFINDVVIPALAALAAIIAEDVVSKLTTLYNFFVDNILPILSDVASAIRDDLNPLWAALGVAVDLAKSSFSLFKDQVEGVLDAITRLISKARTLSEIDLGSVVSGVGGSLAGFVGLAEGGIVTRATAAIVGEDGPEVVVPLGPGRRDRLFELAKASGLDQIILNNFSTIDALPASPGGAEFQGLSRAIEATSAPAPSASSGGGGGSIEPAPAPVRNFYITAEGVSIEEVIEESETRSDSELRSESVGV